jgi:carbon storage regulator CsrA
MLVLSRKVNETILIDDGKIRITVVRVKSGTVRLGIEADADIRAVRGEIAQKTNPVTSEDAAAAGVV